MNAESNAVNFINHRFAIVHICTIIQQNHALILITHRLEIVAIKRHIFKRALAVAKIIS